MLAAKGEIEAARTLYEEGLAFWQAKKHPHWIRRFEQRIQRLDSRLGDIADGQEAQ